jgi:hypothetical protein
VRIKDNEDNSLKVALKSSNQERGYNMATMAYLVSGIKSRHNILCFGIAIYHILWYNISTGSNDSKEPKV